MGNENCTKRSHDAMDAGTKHAHIFRDVPVGEMDLQDQINSFEGAAAAGNRLANDGEDDLS